VQFPAGSNPIAPSIVSQIPPVSNVPVQLNPLLAEIEAEASSAMSPLAGARGAPQQPVLAMPSPTVIWASVTALFGAVLSGAVWAKRQQRVAAVENSVELSAPLAPALAVATASAAALTPPASVRPGLRAKLTQACRVKVAESFQEELLARVVWEVTQKKKLAPAVFMVDPQPQSQAAAPAVFAVAAETEAQGVVKPTKAPETFNIVDKAPEKELYRATREQIALIEGLDDWAEKEMLPILKGVEDSWQPQDYLPDACQEDWLDRIKDIKEMNADMPDEVMISLVGDMITEEALPTYQTMLNTMEGIEDQTGSDETAWARWTRAWTAEENRHGDLLNKYLWCTGRVNMRAVEKTIQYLIGSGMDPGLDKNPYLGYVYTSFQERATKISHGNTGRLAKAGGDATLGKICNLIAADEGRHEIAYQKVVSKLFEEDPNGAIHAYEDMMKKNIVMPAHLMYDGENPNLWDQFSGVAENIGVYTAEDYATIVEFLNRKWTLADRSFDTGEAAAAQEYLIALPDRIRRLGAAASKRKARKGPSIAKISWIYDRPVQY
jgi:acyl-[acyl-carrier-protein] desaturase